MLVKIKPTSLFFDEMNEVFDQFVKKNHSINPFKNFGNTAVNIKENEEKFLIELTAPGFEKENFSAKIESKTLIVRGELSSETETTGAYRRKEYQAQSFQRCFNLPENINEECISASYKNGILFIEIPKKQQEKPKEIEIKLS
jgi:HSP20 family protein